MRLSSIITTLEFTREIESLVKSKNMTYMEAVMHFGEQRGLEIETVGQLVRASATIKSKLSEEAEKLNLIEKEARLPV